MIDWSSAEVSTRERCSSQGEAARCPTRAVGTGKENFIKFVCLMSH